MGAAANLILRVRDPTDVRVKALFFVVVVIIIITTHYFHSPTPAQFGR